MREAAGRLDPLILRVARDETRWKHQRDMLEQDVTIRLTCGSLQ